MHIYEMGYQGEERHDLARVTAVWRGRLDLMTEEGPRNGIMRGMWDKLPVTGDFVQICPLDGETCLAEGILPRRTVFERRDPTVGRDKGAQAVAANFDTVFIVTSLNGDFSTRRLERYLTLAWQSGGEPVFVLTKKDLCPHAETLKKAAEALGAPALCISAKTGEGMEQLDPWLQPGKTTALLGSSGVGKSSLVNALMGEKVMKTNVTRQVDESKGRHTTTHRELLFLANGAMLIDTPGMREMGMWDVSEGLEKAFPEVEALLNKCRFRNCRHESEPGCAVKMAIENGEVTRERVMQYFQLKKEARFSDDPGGALREKYERNKAIAKAMRLQRNGRGK